MYWRKSLLVIHQIPRLFVNTLTVDEKHYLLNRDNVTEPIQMQLSKKEKTFPQIIFEFFKSILNFEHLPKKMTLIAYVFPEYRFPKTCFGEWLKRSVSEDP